MKTLPIGIILLSFCSLVWAIEPEADSAQVDDQNVVSNIDDIENMEVVRVYGEPYETKAATKLNLSIFETPQVVSVVSRAQIEDFSLRDVNSLLSYAPGVTVESVETDRTYYTARGFDIVNFQYDSVGVPFSYGLTQGQDDTAIYEQVEVVKGATGLITGLANPSATVNYVRKRPTKDLQASVSATVGSWSLQRIDGDISGSLTDKVQGRLVVVKEKGDSYMDRYSSEKDVVYGLVSAELTNSTVLTIGSSFNKSHADGASYGALPLFYSDGSQTDYDVSANTAPDWAFRKVTQTRSFVELAQALSDVWEFKAIYSLNDKEQKSELFYLSGDPAPLTEAGLSGFASKYEAKDKEQIVDIFVNGYFDLWGQSHELVIGANYADIKLTGQSVYSTSWYYTPIGNDWAEGSTARPVFDIADPATQSADIDQQQKSIYLSTRLYATDRLAFLLGARRVDIEQDGINYGAPQDISDSETVPYIGTTFQLFNSTMLYGSYSEVFNPQTWVDDSLKPLGPVRGEGSELGIKQEVNSGKAVITAAWFKSRQENFGEWVRRDTTSGLNIYRGVEFESSGFELEFSGEVATGWNISAGITKLKVEDKDGEETRQFIPTEQFKLATAYQVPILSGLRIGAGLNWQNEIYVGDEEVQASYALLDLFAQYDLNNNFTVALNIGNATNKKHLESPQWGQANYGSPRNLLASMTWRY